MEQPFRCPTCRTEFSTLEQLEQHMRQHGSQTTGPPKPGEIRTPGQGKNPGQGSNPGMERGEGQTRTSGTSQEPRVMDHRCPMCGVEFANREELDRHVRAQHRAE
jgi:uncharacterized C2H2 Zn-finger protein